MKVRLRCKLFGHDFREVRQHRELYGSIREESESSDYCRHCGLTKKEVNK